MMNNRANGCRCTPRIVHTIHTCPDLQEVKVLNDHLNKLLCKGMNRVDAEQLHASLACALPLTTIVSARAPPSLGFT